VKSGSPHFAKRSCPAPHTRGKALRARAEARLEYLPFPDVFQRHRRSAAKALGQRKLAIRQHRGQSPLDSHSARLQFEGVAGRID